MGTSETAVASATARDLWHEKFGHEWTRLIEVSEDLTWRRILHTLIQEGKVERHELANNQGPVYRLLGE